VAADVERIARLTERQAAQRRSIIEQLLRLLLGLWGGFDGWTDQRLVTGQAAASATLVDTALVRTRRLTRSYLTSVLAEMGLGDLRLPSQVDLYPRSGVSELAVYARPVKQFLYEQSTGASLEEATAVAMERLKAIATQDVKTADRDESHAIYEAIARVIGYRRVIHPELSKSGTCGLCLVASQRRYSTDELEPLHGPSCNCTTLPIVKGDDPGFRVNDADLKAIYAEAGSTAAEDLLNTRITINEHGELGPILTKKGDHFRGPREAGGTAYERPTPASVRELRTKELEVLRDQLAAADDAYREFVQNDPDGVPLGGDAGVGMFRAAKQMRDRITAVEIFLKTLPA
jgi:hypothetical protein